MVRTLFWSSLFLLCLTCSKTTPIQQPEEVLVDYIQYLHFSDFAQASALCTPAGAAYVTALETIMVAVDDTPDSSKVDIKSLRCTIHPTDTVAQCEVLLDDGFERYSENYQLRLRAGRWRIHHEPEIGETTTSEEPRNSDPEQ